MIILFVLLPSRRVSDPFQRSMHYRIHPPVVFAILQYLWRRLYQDKEFYLVFQFLTGRNLRSQNSVQPLLGLHKYKHKYKRKYKHKSWSRICQFSIKPCNHCCCRDSDCHPHDNQSHFSRCVGAFSCVCRRAFDSLRSRPLFFSSSSHRAFSFLFFSLAASIAVRLIVGMETTWCLFGGFHRGVVMMTQSFESKQSKSSETDDVISVSDFIRV